jgi:hypothetical protein
VPLEVVMKHTRHHSEDVQELAVALLLEPFGNLVDGLADCMSDPIGPRPCALPTIHAVRDLIDRYFQWAQQIDFQPAAARRRFWYVSACKLEPRLGDRFCDPGADLETPLDIAFRIKALAQDIPKENEPLSRFLARHPEHDLAVSRTALAPWYPYAEIRDNLISEDCRPVDMLRGKLSFFGAAKFDPKSDLWTRITLCQGAPLADELATNADDWWLPVFPR